MSDSWILLHLEEECWGMKRWWRRKGRKNMRGAGCMWIPCVWWARQNEHMRGENTELHPILPPASLCYHRPSLCVCGCVSERNNAVPQSPSTIVVVGGWKGCLKRGGLGGIQARVAFFLPTVCGKTLWGTQTRHSFTHRHYTTPAAPRQCRRVRREGWGRVNRGTFQTEGG